MFLRVEVFGHYLEIGRTTEAVEAVPVPDNVPQPMQIYAEPLGFRVIGDEGFIAPDVSDSRP